MTQHKVKMYINTNCTPWLNFSIFTSFLFVKLLDVFFIKEKKQDNKM